MTFGQKVIEYYASLSTPTNLPRGVEILYPFSNNEVMSMISQFNNTYFDDDQPRTFLIGINPGRLGAGITGIPFTDPIRLEEELGITNDFDKKAELSSNFVYQMINHLGGAKLFYSRHYFTSVCPVGFVKEGNNLNYYDIKALQEAIEHYAVEELQKQIEFGANPIAYSIGKGKNIAYLQYLNKKYQLFKKIEPLPHPRWVMQYRLKRLNEFLDLYRETLIS